ncbi:diaminopimelate epimerase [Actinokineospora alba]|uniref:Diaminopimelate epimerase n=1 Tax=Actinokineospora alba TaxID=504798 RepID=A0A1H0JGK4_9PSEU|nr:diaminopimelate epimerase [Actinokineospora alba]TDP68296.1 diaminopimelate epimerase [Actinokineospora alba]SDH96289.1 diaminopimelate epimerase [Actinokineospora alba]SDO42935.1 diaminopimelate epimerase [Actinokineospora alba]
MAITFLKGHGTENDFVLLPDPDGGLDLTVARVRALCDRARGLGADGVLRIVRAKALADAPAGIDGDVWFMDYRNADGSIAETCGNGVRVFARYLHDTGLVDGPEFPVGSRAGLRPVVVHPDGTVTIDMGPVRRLGNSVAVVDGATFAGIGIDVGNPHLACVLDSVDLDSLDLTVQPEFDTTLFPNGVNVEFVAPVGPDEIHLRVHERGVGETRSCGTGTVAATAAALAAQGETTGSCTVHIPGGTVHVTISETSSTLTGPAVFVARGELDQAWWDAQR